MAPYTALGMSAGADLMTVGAQRAVYGSHQPVRGEPDADTSHAQLAPFPAMAGSMLGSCFIAKSMKLRAFAGSRREVVTM